VNFGTGYGYQLLQLNIQLRFDGTKNIPRQNSIGLVINKPNMKYITLINLPYLWVHIRNEI